MPETTPFEICDRLTEAYADLSPIAATEAGIPGRDHQWDDFSPEGEAAKEELRARAVADLTPHLGHPDPVQATAARVASGYLESERRLYASGHWKRELNHILGPFQTARDTFDVVSKDGREAWENVTVRLSTWGDMLDGYRASLHVGLDDGETVARRQVLSVIEQVRSVAGPESRFTALPLLAAANGGDEDRVAGAVAVARSASAEFADWLETVYLPLAAISDAAGHRPVRGGIRAVSRIAPRPGRDLRMGMV